MAGSQSLPNLLDARDLYVRKCPFMPMLRATGHARLLRLFHNLVRPTINPLPHPASAIRVDLYEAR